MHGELLELLINEKTDLDQKINLNYQHPQGNANGSTLLFLACYRNYESVVCVLLRKGTNPNATNNLLHAPIHPP